MGCGGSTEAEVTAEDVDVDVTESGVSKTGAATTRLNIAEGEATKAKPKSATFIGTVIKAREVASENADVLADCATRLQAYNRRIKEYVAIYDCETINEAMNGGFMGMGCNDNKLIAAVCTRTKAQLQRTKSQYRDQYDKDVREEVMGETGGAYRKLLYFIFAAKDAYIADVIDMACNEASIAEFGCDEIALLEVFVTHTQEELQEGKDKWEGRTDKSLVDFINENLGSSYRHLNRLLQLLFMGDRVETDEVMEELAQAQVAELKEECDKGWFEDFDESKIIEIIGANTIPQNQLCADLFEKEYGESLASNLEDKCGPRLFKALCALMQPKADFIAMRLHDAMEGWGTNTDILTRLLGGLDGEKMAGVAEAFENKYDQPLWSALKEKVSGGQGRFLKASLAWIESIEAKQNAAEKFTEAEVGDIEGDAGALGEMVDWLLFEHEALLQFVNQLDVETVHEATKCWGTDDTGLIRALATRNKRCLSSINYGYRAAYDENLQNLMESELSGWYQYLAKFLVVQEEQADSMLIDLAMSGDTIDTAALTEFVMARHPKRVRAAKKAWEDRNDDSLVDKLADNLEDTSKDFLKVCLKMLKGKREVGDAADEDQAREQCAELVQLAEESEESESKKKLKVGLITIVCDNSPAENKALARIYEEENDTSLRRTIKKTFDEQAEEALIALLYGPYEWYAAALKKALTGDEVDDNAVCRIVGSHDKDEIKLISEAYERKYNTDLKGAISDACSGDYKRLAVAWVSLSDQLGQPEELIEVPPTEEELEAIAADKEARAAEKAEELAAAEEGEEE